jgi:hypothetical protein
MSIFKDPKWWQVINIDDQANDFRILTSLQVPYMVGLRTRHGSSHRPNPLEVFSLSGWSTEFL